MSLQQKSDRLLTELKPSWCDLNQRAPSRKGTHLIKHRGRNYLLYICGTGDILVIGVKLCIDVFIFVTSGGKMKGTHCTVALKSYRLVYLVDEMKR